MLIQTDLCGGTWWLKIASRISYLAVILPEEKTTYSLVYSHIMNVQHTPLAAKATKALKWQAPSDCLYHASNFQKGSVQHGDIGKFAVYFEF